MKVVLLQDVAKIGRKNAIVNVPDGYALNQLIPKNLAKPATPENLKAAARLEAEKNALGAAREARFFATKSALVGKVIPIKVSKNSGGHLFAGVKAENIAAGLKEAGIEVDAGMIELEKSIKETGEHTINLAHGSHKFSFIINIE